MTSECNDNGVLIPTHNSYIPIKLPYNPDKALSVYRMREQCVKICEFISGNWIGGGGMPDVTVSVR
jgi:hypothetical protein